MRRNYLLGAGVTACALALRLVLLGSQPLNTNEATTAALTHKTWSAIIEGTAQDNHPPLHYLFIHSWARVFGAGEVSIRIPSVVTGTATAFVVWWWASSWLGPAAAAVAGVVIALSPFHVYYSQEARFYGFLGLEAALFWCGVARLARGWNPRLFAVTLLAGILGLYTHNYFGLLAIPLMGIACAWCLLGRDRRRTTLTFLILGAGMAAAYVPWLPVVVRQAQGPGAGSTGPITAGILQHAFRYFMNHGPDVQPWRVLSFALVAFVMVGGLLRWKFVRDRVIAYLPVQLDEFIPAVGLLATSAFVFAVCTIKPLFIQKGMIIVLPAYAVLLAVSWERFRRTVPRTLLILLILTLSARGLYALYTTPRGKDWRAVADRLERDGRPGDLICLREGLIVVPLHYYYLPEQPDTRLPEIQLNSHLQSTEEQLDLVRKEAAGARRIWLVHAHNPDTSVRDSLIADASMFHVMGTWGFRDEGTITLVGVVRSDSS